MTHAEELKSSGLKATLPRIKILEVFQTSAVRHLLDSDGVSRHQMFAVTIASPQTEPPGQAAG